jgi:hypothetical protein
MRFDAPLTRATGHPARSASGEPWFADEVAVDFPSVRPIVSRMRRAFLGGDEDGDAVPLDAELRLTPQQAWRGGRVPVDVPVRQVCRVCGGRGEVWDEACAPCRGAGGGVAPRTVDVHVPSGVRDGACLAFDLRVPHAPATRVRLRVSIC